MIERAWAPLSWQLVGVTLPANLPGEHLPPRQQNDLSAEDQRKEEIEVFNKAIDIMNAYWSGVKIDGFPVILIAVLCSDIQPAGPYHDEESVREYLKAGVTDHL